MQDSSRLRRDTKPCPFHQPKEVGMHFVHIEASRGLLAVPAPKRAHHRSLALQPLARRHFSHAPSNGTPPRVTHITPQQQQQTVQLHTLFLLCLLEATDRHHHCCAVRRLIFICSKLSERVDISLEELFHRPFMRHHFLRQHSCSAQADGPVHNKGGGVKGVRATKENQGWWRMYAILTLSTAVSQQYHSTAAQTQCSSSHPTVLSKRAL